MLRKSINLSTSQISGLNESNFTDDEFEDEDDKDTNAIRHRGESVMMMEDNSNIISVQKVVGSEESAFLVYPSPGQRSMSLVGKQELFNVKTMIFVSNDTLAIQFNNGKIVFLSVYGTVREQRDYDIRSKIESIEFRSRSGE